MFDDVLVANGGFDFDLDHAVSVFQKDAIRLVLTGGNKWLNGGLNHRVFFPLLPVTLAIMPTL